MATQLTNLDLKTLQNNSLVGIKISMLTYEPNLFSEKTRVYTSYINTCLGTRFKILWRPTAVSFQGLLPC